MTQTERVHQYMRDFGSITQLEAMADLGVMRLASRINDMKRQGAVTEGVQEMDSAELIKGLKDAERYIAYVAPSCYASNEALEAIRDAADLIEAQAKRIAELEAQMPKEGEWRDDNGAVVPLDDYGYTTDLCQCSVCGDWLIASDEYEVRGRYCPNCGSRMRKGEQE